MGVQYHQRGHAIVDEAGPTQRLHHSLRQLASHPNIRVMSVAQGLLRREPAAAIEAIKRASDLIGPVWGKFRLDLIRTPVPAEAGAGLQSYVLTIAITRH